MNVFEQSEIQHLAKKLLDMTWDVCWQGLSIEQEKWCTGILRFAQKYTKRCNKIDVTFKLDENVKSVALQNDLELCLKKCQDVLEYDDLIRSLKPDLLLVWLKLEICYCLFKELPICNNSRQLGGGGFGMIYLMNMPKANHPVAVKVFEISMPPCEIASEIFNTKYVLNILSYTTDDA